PVTVQGCSYKTFMNGKPHPFNGTEGVIGLRRWIEKVEQVFEICKCAEEDKVMFAASTFEGCALTWWNGNVHTLGLVNANRDDIEAYNNCFHELALMCPDLVPNEKKKIERYMKGFPERIKGNITSARPTTLHEAVDLAWELVEQVVQGKATRASESNKRIWEEHQINHPNNNNNTNNCNRNRNNNTNTQYHQQNKRQETARAYAAAPAEGKTYARNLPKCNRCNLHHIGRCHPKCRRCQRDTLDTSSLREGTNGTKELVGELIILFDSGAERSFVSIEFTPFIKISPVALNTSYDVELADGKIVSTNTVLRGCTLALFSHMFKIDLLQNRLGSFDVIIRMDWLSYRQAVIVCYEKIVRIPLLNGEILEIHGEKPEKDSKSLSCIKVDEVRLDDIRTVCDFPEVFPDDLIDFEGVTDWYQEPRMMKRMAINKMVKKQIAVAIEEYERTRVDLGNASGSGEVITGGPMTVQGCSHKTFMNGKPHPFNGTEGVVGLRRWIEKVEQVFEICKCAEEDKVMFVASTFEGRALTWWNENVHTLGLVNANRIPWTEFKSMMTTEYCPATEIQRMEQELWTLTLKGDDIEAYNNRFHGLALMCPDLVPNEKKKIKRIWEEHQRNHPNNNNNPNNRNRNHNNNNNNTQYHQQNRRQETARAYAAAPAEGKTYAGNLPKCNRCYLHHIGHCPPKCRSCQKLGHIKADCRTRLPGTDENLIRNVTCYGCGEKGRLRHQCPKGRNQ
nr:hypothetical protein [Tanacetum cinerariifolium]